MVLVDVNLLIYAVFADTPRHKAARAWIESTFGGPELVALPWAVLAGFVRIATNSRAVTHPLTLGEAIAYLDEWLELPTVRLIGPTGGHRETFTRMLRAANVTGNLVSDAHLAALAAEHGCALASTDDDFRRFPNLNWFNPLAPKEPIS